MNRLDKYCGSTGFKQLRAYPRDADFLAAGNPAYAEIKLALEICDDVCNSGYLAHYIAFCLPPIKSIGDVLRHMQVTDSAVDTYIRNSSFFFMESGGFELARLTYYFNDVERDEVEAELNRSNTSLALRHRLGFRDFANAMHQ